MWRRLTLTTALLAAIASHSQEWEAMDFGFQFINFATSNVKDVYVDKLNGEVYAAGSYIYLGDGSFVDGLTKWDPHEERWVASDSINQGTGYSIAKFNNKLYVSGSFNSLTDQTNDSKLYNYSYESLTAIDEGPEETIFTLKTVSDQLLVLGSFKKIAGDSSTGIGIISENGIQSIYDDRFTSERLDGAAEWRDTLYFVGKGFESTLANVAGLAKLKDGKLENVHSEFAAPKWSWVYAAETFQDKLFVGGNFNPSTGHTGLGIQYFDGEDMHALDGGVNNTVFDMMVYKDELYIAGGFTRIGAGTQWASDEGGIPCHGIAKWDGEEWTCLFDGEFSLFDGIPLWYGVKTIDIYEDTLYIGGNWRSMDGDTAKSCIARRKIFPKPGISNLNNLTVFPNPTTSQVTLDFGKLIGIDGKFRLYDDIGKLVRDENIPAWRVAHVVDVSQESTGMYILVVRLGEAVETRRIIIE